jgi:hypothetical protein
MLSRMDPSLPPDMRTLHLLKSPDILCANDKECLGIIEFVKDNDHLLRSHHNGFVETEAIANANSYDPTLARSGAGPERDVIWILARESPMTSRLAAP